MHTLILTKEISWREDCEDESEELRGCMVLCVIMVNCVTNVNVHFVQHLRIVYTQYFTCRRASACSILYIIRFTVLTALIMLTY